MFEMTENSIALHELVTPYKNMLISQSSYTRARQLFEFYNPSRDLTGEHRFKPIIKNFLRTDFRTTLPVAHIAQPCVLGIPRLAEYF